MEGDGKPSKIDRKKEKELEEARKAGTAPPEVDEEGRDINPHIPQYIKSVPWYFGKNEPTLKHQRPQEEKQVEFAGVNETYIRGKPTGPASLKYKAGACENCGATTHKKKDCMERPRKIGAKFTNKDIQPDDYVQPSLNFSYDGKRDHWAYYDTEQHSKVVEEFARVEKMKRQLKADKIEDDLKEGIVDSEISKNIDNDEFLAPDDDKYSAEASMPGQKFDPKQRLTVRNLRIREDTAKYLYNLDIDSAFYDPKSRSMRENPLENNEKSKLIEFKGENERINVEDVRKVSQAQLFSWQASEAGVDVHLQADPTKAELLLRQYQTNTTDQNETAQSKLLNKYGGEEHLHAPPKELLFAQTEEYVEYSKSGQLIKGQEKAFVKSKYEEDVFHNNHTSVWGSYWKNFQWGYACCHSFIKNSYCVGLKTSSSTSLFKLPKLNDEDLASTNKRPVSELLSSRDDTSKNGDTTVDNKNGKQFQPEIIAKKAKQSKYNSIYHESTPTESEMESYYKNRPRNNDPLENFKG